MSKFIDPENDIIQIWKYEVSEFTILYTDGTYEIPSERLTGFSVYNDYENNLFPIIKLNATIEPVIYSKLVKNKDTLKLKVRIQKYYTKMGEEKKSLMRDYINDTFSLILDEEYHDTDRKVRKEEEQNAVGKNHEEINTLDQKIGGTNELYLYNQHTINALRNMVNDVLCNVTMIGAIGYIGSKIGVKNMLVSPLENNRQYPELLLPPQTALSTLQYLDTEYGFYKVGSMIYFGMDRSYILNYKGDCTVWENGEIKETCIMVTQKGGTTGPLSSSIEKVPEIGLRKYIAVNPDTVKMTDKTISNNIVDGNTATIINTNTNTVTNASSGSVQGGNTKIINTNTSNPWLGETFAAQKSADKITIDCTCQDFDIDAIAPNKKFTFLFEDTKYTEQYKGTYKLVKSDINFSKNGGYLQVRADLTFKKADIVNKIETVT